MVVIANETALPFIFKHNNIIPVSYFSWNRMPKTKFYMAMVLQILSHAHVGLDNGGGE